MTMKGKNIERKGIELNSTKDIAVFCLNHVDSTADGYLALPTSAVGTTYVVASYIEYGYSNFGIISGANGTKIQVILNTSDVDEKIVYGGISYYKGGSLRVTLDKLETFQIVHSSDLSGSIIISNKPISVLSGNTCANLGTCCCDHLVAFLLPVENWGKTFISTATGTLKKGYGDIFRVFAYQNNTVVSSLYDQSVLSSGEYMHVDLGFNLASSIDCSKPCQVVQYVKGFNIKGITADPSMIVVPSVEQFLSYYTVVLYAGLSFQPTVSLLIRLSYKNGLIKNGNLMSEQQWKRINGTEFAWSVVNVSGSNFVTFYHSLPEVTFGLLVFGYKSYASYGYPGGFSFPYIHRGMKRFVAIINTFIPLTDFNPLGGK